MVGLVVMILLPKPTKEKEDDEEENPQEEVTGPVQALVKAGRLFVTRNMLMLSITFLYTGKFIKSSYCTMKSFSKFWHTLCQMGRAVEPSLDDIN